MSESVNLAPERLKKPSLGNRIRRFGRRSLATAAATAALLTGCSGDEEPRISEGHLWKLKNVAGACIYDGANVRGSNPKPDAGGKPSDREQDWGPIIHNFDTDGIPENGVKISPKRAVAENPNNVVCFDTNDGEVPFVTTERPDAATRYWYTFSLEELDDPVGKERHFAMKALIEAARDSGVNNVVVASDGVSVASTLGNHLEVVKA